MGTILLIVLILLLLGAFNGRESLGNAPVGGLGLILIIVLILVLFGQIPYRW